MPRGSFFYFACLDFPIIFSIFEPEIYRNKSHCHPGGNLFIGSTSIDYEQKTS